MKLIGMLDSPFVRRSAISFECLGIAFEHAAISVFSTFPEFQKINPVVKAPSLVLDDGTVLMDSNLIIQYGEAISAKSLLPANIAAKTNELRILGFALAACEKAAQYIYEKNLRPAGMQFEPWLTRVSRQLTDACQGLESLLAAAPESLCNESLTQAAITSAVAWQFIQSMLPELIPAAEYPRLTQHTAAMEARAEFLKYPPVGPGVIASN